MLPKIEQLQANINDTSITIHMYIQIYTYVSYICIYQDIFP